MSLLEREEQTLALRRLVTRACAGEGGVVVVSGEAGIGKTSVLEAVAAAARSGSARVLHAAGGELESDFAFGVVRSLFSTLVEGPCREQLLIGSAALSDPVFRPRADAGPNEPAGVQVMHGLYWLTVGACDTAPHVLLVDDVQWADTASLRFLGYLGRRLDGLRCLLVLGLRAGPGSRVKSDVLALTQGPGVESIELSPLGADGARRLISARLGTTVDGDFAAECHAATGGNPFLVLALAAELAHREIRGLRSDVGRVSLLGGEGVASWLRRRLHRCGAPAVALARAVAVLGPSAAYRRVGMLAKISDEVAGSAVEGLIEEGVLVDGHPLGFVHPMVRAAVIRELGPSLSARWHAGAARLLAADGEQEEAAHHFRLAEPLGDPLAVAVLSAAAERAMSRGAPDVAAAYLARALEEPPDQAARAEIRYKLGTAALHANMPEAAAHLAQAYDEASRVNVRAQIAVLLARCQLWAGDVSQSVATKERALAEGGDPASLAALEVALLEDATASPEARRLLAGRISRLRERRSFDPSERGLMAVLALEQAITDGPAHRAAALAQAALSDGVLSAEAGDADTHCSMALIALAVTDHRSIAIPMLDRLLANLSGRGSLWAHGANLAFRGWALLRFGELRDAEADLHTSLEERYGGPGSITAPLALGSLIETRLERHGLEAALDAMAEFADVDVNDAAATSDPLPFARARVALARNRPEEALVELRSCQAFERAFGGRCPAWSPWRVVAARAHLALGDHELARSLAAEHHAYATAFGGANVIGMALHCRGLAENSLPLLREAASTLQQSSARLQHAHALVDLGAVLRSRRQLVEAREPLRAGLDLAVACGARPLAAHAREELVTAGARPRRERSTGADSLTPSELRTARLAAGGLSNREIAQAGFVSPRTVEMHLSNTYVKLGIRTREQLRELLPELAGSQPGGPSCATAV